MYTLEDVLAADTATATGGNKCFLGAGAGSFSLMGCNCELMPNVNLTTDSILTQTAKVDDDGTASLHPHKSTEFALLMNLLVHSGQVHAFISLCLLCQLPYLFLAVPRH